VVYQRWQTGYVNFASLAWSAPWRHWFYCKSHSAERTGLIRGSLNHLITIITRSWPGTRKFDSCVKCMEAFPQWFGWNMLTYAIGASKKLDQTSRRRIFIDDKHRWITIRTSHWFARIGVIIGWGASITFIGEITIYCDILWNIPQYIVGRPENFWFSDRIQRLRLDARSTSLRKNRLLTGIERLEPNIGTIIGARPVDIGN